MEKLKLNPRPRTLTGIALTLTLIVLVAFAFGWGPLEDVWKAVLAVLMLQVWLGLALWHLAWQVASVFKENPRRKAAPDDR